MDALELLTTRRSNKKLVAPAPNAEQLERIFQAALRSPDHGRLQPYRFVVIEKQGLPKFVEVLKQVVSELNLEDKHLAKAEAMAEKPMIIAVIAKLNPDIAKVPAWEQLLTAGCATYAMQLAAQAQGFDNVWISGKWTEGSALRKAFGCTPHEQIVALLMVGSPAEQKQERDHKPADISSFISYF